ncbi:MAG TPA: hypothetical protein VIU12_35370 [Chryseolinea sp.]
MKSTKLALAVLMLVGLGRVQAQEYAFKVLVSKGKNELKSGSAWQPLKVGASLKPADELKLSENSYVGLVTAAGRPFEVKKPAGTYKVIDFAKQVKPEASVLNKYTDFVLSSATSPKNSLAATGAVDRGFDRIEINLPNKAERADVFGSKVIISWHDEKKLKPYIVAFKTMFGDELVTRETSDTWVEVDLSDPAFGTESNIVVTVTSKIDKNRLSEGYTLRKISKANREKLKAPYAEIAAATAEHTAINKLYQAAFFEQNNLLVDAGTAFQEAAKLEPAYQQAYTDFLVRNNIKTLVKK